MKISVVIPTIGRPTLRRAIDSVLNQSYQDFEIIVVSDGVDINPAIVKGCRYYKIKKSGFHAAPRNRGIIEAKGRYVANLDDDNEFLFNHLELLIQSIESGDYDFTYGRRQYVNETGAYMQSQFFEWKPENAWMPFWLDCNDLMTTKKLMIDMGGWNEEITRFGDYELGCRFAKFGANGIGVNAIITNMYDSADGIGFRKENQDVDPIKDLSNTKVIQKWIKK